MVVVCLSDTPVPSCYLATLEFRQGAMNAYKEHIKRSEQLYKASHPRFGFDNVLNN